MSAVSSAAPPASLRADFPPNPRPSVFTRLLFAVCVGIGFGGYWNVRRGWMFCKYWMGDILIEPTNWAVLIAMMVAGAVLAFWGSGRLPRRVRPWTGIPLAIGVWYSAIYFAWDFLRNDFSFMFWMTGLGMSLGLFFFDQGTFAWAWRKISLHRRLSIRWWAFRASWFLLLAGATFVSTFMANFAIRLLQDFMMYVFDQGNLNQSMWTLANFGDSTTTTMNYLNHHDHGFHWWAEHFTPFQFFILPFYYPFQSAESMNVIMFIFTGLTIPMLAIAVHAHLRSWPIALALAITFCFHPLWIRVLYICFHYETFFPFFIFGAYYFYAKRAPLGFIVCLLVCFSMKESMPLGVMAWGATTVIFHTGRRKWGILMFVLGAAYFYLSMKVIVDVYRHGEPFATMATRYSHLFAERGIEIDSTGTLIKSCLMYPLDVFAVIWRDWRWMSFMKLLMPFVFVCLLRPWTVCIFLPTTMMHILTDFQPQFQLEIYHAGEILPYVVIATVTALEKGPRPLFHGRLRRYRACVGLAMLMAVYGAHVSRSFLYSGGLFAKLPPVYKRRMPDGPRLKEFLLNVPVDYRVASLGNALVPLSNRLWALHYEYPEGDMRMLAADSEAPSERYRHPWTEYVDHIILIAPRLVEIAPHNEITLDEYRVLLPETMKSGEWVLYRPWDNEEGILWMTRGEGGIENVDQILEEFFVGAEGGYVGEEE